MDRSIEMEGGSAGGAGGAGRGIETGEREREREREREGHTETVERDRGRVLKDKEKRERQVDRVKGGEREAPRRVALSDGETANRLEGWGWDGGGGRYIQRQ